MKNFIFLLLLCGGSLVVNSQNQPPKKLIPVDKTIKIHRVYKNYKPIVTSEIRSDGYIRILVDTTKNKRDSIFVYY
jgi:hypothetical protein